MKYLVFLAGIVFILIIYFVITFYKYISNNSLEESIKSENYTTTVEQDNQIQEDIKQKENSEKNLKMKVSYLDEEYDLELNLYDEITPLTCKNFRMIAKFGIDNKTYNNCEFHRVIPGFMFQGGDIVNGDGTGSISMYNSNFEDENFIKKHDKPGLLSMANSGPNTNGCQFFITTVPTPHLDNKHVVFGEITKGLDILYKLELCSTDSNDKPVNPIKIVNISEI